MSSTTQTPAEPREHASSSPATNGSPASNERKHNTRPPRRPSLASRLFRPRVLGALCLVAAVLACVFAAVFPASRWVTAYGYVNTDEEAELRPAVEGAITAWHASSGDTVQAGALLVQLNNTVQVASLEEARSNVASHEAALERLVSAQAFRDREREQQITQATHSLELVRGQLERIRGAGTGFSRKEIEEAELKVRLAESRLSELKLDNDELEAKQAFVLRQEIDAAKKRVAVLEAERAMREVRAPLAGTVYFNSFEPGEVVKPEHVLGQVFDTGTWVVKLKLTEREMRFVEVGQPAEVAFRAYPTLTHGTATATVTRILPVVTPAAAGDGVFYLEAELIDLAGLAPQPGMSVQAEINTGRTTLLRAWTGL